MNLKICERCLHGLSKISFFDEKIGHIKTEIMGKKRKDGRVWYCNKWSLSTDELNKICLALIVDGENKLNLTDVIHINDKNKDNIIACVVDVGDIRKSCPHYIDHVFHDWYKK